MTPSDSYAARLTIDYPEKLNRLTTLFRIFLAIPIVLIVWLLHGAGSGIDTDDTSQEITIGGSVSSGLFVATVLMIVFRHKYPRWWFDFVLELSRFGTRVISYLCLLTDQYPSATEAQSVHLDIDYPDAERDLNRWMPLVKWLLVLPHAIVLAFLALAAIAAVLVSWVAILITGRYPQPLFEFVVGVGRWSFRVSAYAILLVTDRYPPFSLR